MHRNLTGALALILVACGGTGDWTVATWGEDFIEEGIPASGFEDGCSVVFDRFSVDIQEAALLDGNGDTVASLTGERFDLVQPGPQTVGSTSVQATHFDTARFVVGGAGGVQAAGTLTCGADSVDFDWSFDETTTYLCEPDGLSIPSGGGASTELTIHGDHLFYDDLASDDAVLRGQAIVDADADGDGIVTQAELSAVPVAELGYGVGQYSEVSDLGAFVAFLTRTLGHVDGEGHCQVDL